MAADYKLPPSRPVTAECADLLSRILTQVKGLHLLKMPELTGLTSASRFCPGGLGFGFLSVCLRQSRGAAFCLRGMDLGHSHTRSTVQPLLQCRESQWDDEPLLVHLSLQPCLTVSAMPVACIPAQRSSCTLCQPDRGVPVVPKSRMATPCFARSCSVVCCALLTQHPTACPMQRCSSSRLTGTLPPAPQACLPNWSCLHLCSARVTVSACRASSSTPGTSKICPSLLGRTSTGSTSCRRWPPRCALPSNPGLSTL